MIASAGNTNGIDSTSLASLTAGNIAATSGLAKLCGEKEFSILFHEGEWDNIHISLIFFLPPDNCLDRFFFFLFFLIQQNMRTYMVSKKPVNIYLSMNIILKTPLKCVEVNIN